MWHTVLIGKIAIFCVVVLTLPTQTNECDSQSGVIESACGNVPHSGGAALVAIAAAPRFEAVNPQQHLEAVNPAIKMRLHREGCFSGSLVFGSRNTGCRGTLNRSTVVYRQLFISI